MQYNPRYARIIRRSYRQIALFALIGLVASLVAIFVQPLRYGATVRLLIIQRSTIGIDPYTAVKSAERIADSLSQVIYTQDFFNKTLKQDPSIDQTNFPTDPSNRRAAWQSAVRTSLVTGTGLLSVTALSEDKTEAAKIAQSIADVLTVSGKDYISGDLDVKLVDSPIVSRYPISPNIPLGVGLGFGGGLLAGIFYVLWNHEGRREQGT